jgi:PKD repeat protein
MDDDRTVTANFEKPSKSYPTRDYPPNADASKSQTSGFVEESIEFDGSLSYDNEGPIIEYIWDFDDGETGDGMTTTHNYSNTGIYHVTLTVYDDGGNKDEDIIDVVILTGNNPPSKPTIEGPTDEDDEPPVDEPDPDHKPIIKGPATGHRDSDLEFSALSIDADNDSLQYIFDWGDNETTRSEFMQNGTPALQTHSWVDYGAYNVSVKAFDNVTESEISIYTVYIDVFPIDDEIQGYLIDEDSDDTYDSFENSDNGEKTDVEKENDTYLIDIDADGRWDYAFNPDEIEFSTYHIFLYNKFYRKWQLIPGFEIVSVIAMIALLLIIRRRKKF